MSVHKVKFDWATKPTNVKSLKNTTFMQFVVTCD